MDTLLMNTGLKYMNEQVDQEIAEIDLPQIADLFDNIDDLCEQFGLSAADKTDVETERRLKGTRKSAKKALKIWREQNPFKATFKSLLTIKSFSAIFWFTCLYVSEGTKRKAYYHYFFELAVVILAICMGLVVRVLYNKHSLIPITLTMTNFKGYN